MSFLTIQSYRTLTGLPLVGVNDNYINYKLNQLSKSLVLLTGQNWDVQIAKLHIKDSQTKVTFNQAHQETGLIISAKDRGDTAWKILIKDTDYQIIYPSFISSNPAVGIDMRCYKCICECESIKIEGLPFWQNSLPDDLLQILIDQLETLLKLDNNSYTNGQIPLSAMVNDIKRESDQTRLVDWVDNSVEINMLKAKLSNGVNHEDYWSFIEPYRLASMKLYQRARL